MVKKQRLLRVVIRRSLNSKTFPFFIKTKEFITKVKYSEKGNLRNKMDSRELYDAMHPNPIILCSCHFSTARRKMAAPKKDGA